MEPYDFERVSPTALGPVIARGEFTEIPFAREILTYLKQHSAKIPENNSRLQERASFFESRFKAVSRILAERNATQILELASGFSPRGLAFRGGPFVEVDLPKMIAQKQEIVTELLGSIPAYLHFCPASVLDFDQLAPAFASFNNAPVFVTSEGLLRYLTFDEKAILARNVKRILERFGGAWITPDVHLKQWAHQRNSEWSFTAQLERDITVNYFDDLAHARAFFEGCGFQIEEHPLLEGIAGDVASLPFATPSLRDELDQRRIFTLTL